MQRVADVQNNLVRDGGGVSAVAEDLRNQSNKQRVVDGRFRLDFQRASLGAFGGLLFLKRTKFQLGNDRPHADYRKLTCTRHTVPRASGHLVCGGEEERDADAQVVEQETRKTQTVWTHVPTNC